MNAYTPNSATVTLVVLAALPIVLIIGFYIARISTIIVARSLGWLVVVISVVGMELFTVSQPAGFRMLAIIGILLYSMKTVVAVEARSAGKPFLSFAQWIGFAGFWVGMRPALFRHMGRSPRSKVTFFFWRGTNRLAVGLGLVLAARTTWLVGSEWDPSPRLFLTTVLLLPGISLMLHFGVFNLLTAFWRLLGAECDSLFKAPLLSRSLAEFWGKRWNLAFSEMTTLAVFRPIRGSFGKNVAIITAFVFSGLLHELAISVPVRAGFGMPLLYFAVHGLAMLMESRWTPLSQAINSRPVVGRIWTAAWVLLPLPILFHPPFLRGCVWPLIGIE